MREFLVTLLTTVPDGTEQAEVDRRWAAEGQRAKELGESGNLVRLWRPVGAKHSISLWRAEDEADLRTNILEHLPLWPWMTAEVTPLEAHPNDPGR